MNTRTLEILKGVRHGGTRLATIDELREWYKLFAREIRLNESCQLREEETEDELRKLLDARCRVLQQLSIRKEVEQ